MPTLKARAEFLAVRGGRRASLPSFLIETRERPTDAKRADGPRFGFTITKKIGNAVTRNRIRRRLKAAFAAEFDKASRFSDYVIVARLAALDRPYAQLLDDVRQAFVKLQASGSPGRRPPRPRGEPDSPKKGSA